MARSYGWHLWKGRRGSVMEEMCSSPGWEAVALSQAQLPTSTCHGPSPANTNTSPAIAEAPMGSSERG